MMIDAVRPALYKPRFRIRSLILEPAMAQHQSAKKRIRRNEKRRKINHARVSRVRTFVKSVEAAIASGDQEAASLALRLAQPEMHRGVSKGVVHRNTAARKLSRLSRRIKAMPANQVRGDRKRTARRPG